MTTDRPVLVFLLRPVLAVRAALARKEERRWLDAPEGCCSCGTGGPYYTGEATPVTRYLYVDACGPTGGSRPDWASCSAHPLPDQPPAVDYGRDVTVTCRQAEADIARALRDGPDVIDPGSVSLGLLGAVLAVLVAVAVVAAGPPPALGVMAVLVTAGVVAWGVARHVRGVEADRRDALIDMIDDLDLRIDDLLAELDEARAERDEARTERDEARADRSALCAQSARRTDASLRQYQHCRELIDQVAAMRAELDEARTENARLRGEHASEDTGAEPPARQMYRLVYAYRDQDGTTGQQDLYVDLTPVEVTALSGLLAETTDRADGAITLPAATTPDGPRDPALLRVCRIISLDAIDEGDAS